MNQDKDRVIKRALWGLVLLSLAGAAVFAAGYLLRKKLPDPLLRVEPGLVSLGARLDKVTLTVWEPLPSAATVDAVADRVARELGGVLDATPAATTAPGAGSERRAYLLPEKRGRLALTLRRTDPVAVSALLELPAPADGWWVWRARLTRAMRWTRRNEPRVYTVLEYSEPGERLWSSRRTVATGILYTLGARLVEGADDENLYSLTAYTPRLGSRLLVAGKPVNAAVALHWDAAAGRTVLWLGSPVINVEY